MEAIGWTRRRVLFLGISATLAVGLLIAAREVLLPFVLAIIIAYVLTPLVAFCERYRIPRGAAVILVYAVTFSLIYVGGAIAVPRVYEEAVNLREEVPQLAKDLATKWGPTAQQRLDKLLGQADNSQTAEASSVETLPVIELVSAKDGTTGLRFNAPVDIVQEGPKHWRVSAEPPTKERVDLEELMSSAVFKSVEYVKRNALELIRVGQAIVSSTTRAVVLSFMTFMCAAYLIHTRDDVMEFFRTLPPAAERRGFDRLMRRIDRGLSGVVRGQLIICGVNGVLSAIGFIVFGLKYWPILALLAAVMSIIPIFGSILSTIPAVLIGLTQDVWTALWVLLWILFIHQLEANLLNPKIIGASAKLHPVLVVFALIVGEHYFGLWGALLAVPALSFSQSCFNHFRYESLPDAGPDSLRTPPLPTPRT